MIDGDGEVEGVVKVGMKQEVYGGPQGESE